MRLQLVLLASLLGVVLTARIAPSETRLQVLALPGLLAAPADLPQVAWVLLPPLPVLEQARRALILGQPHQSPAVLMWLSPRPCHHDLVLHHQSARRQHVSHRPASQQHRPQHRPQVSHHPG